MSETSLRDKLQSGLDSQIAGDRDAAEKIYREALETFPGSADARNLLGSLLAEKGLTDEALPLLEAAVKLQPGIAMFHANFGNLLARIDEHEAALPYLREAVRLQPDFPEALCNLGQCYTELNRIEEARRCYQKAIRCDGTYIRALLLLGSLETNAGDEEASRKAFRQALALDPGDTRAISGVILSGKVKEDWPELIKAESILADTRNPPPRDRHYRLLFAVGKAYNDIGRLTEAMAHLKAAKELSGRSYDINRYRAFVDRIIGLMTPEFFAERANWGSASDRPIFIVGMPRSGTTLTEQIISSHPKVFGAGELGDMARIARALELAPQRAADETETLTEPAPILGATADVIAQFADIYLKRLQFLNRTAQRTTDKMPHNFQFTGLIALMFPNVRIIHCRRDPVDTCLSIYMQNFNDSHDYALDLTTLGLYYREYLRLMDHWRSVLPGRILEIDYEDTVAAVEGQARKMIAAIGLKWDPACLNYHMTRRVVQTASKWQVRQPIYKTSVGRWKRYGDTIAPLLEALGDAAQT